MSVGCGVKGQPGEKAVSHSDDTHWGDGHTKQSCCTLFYIIWKSIVRNEVISVCKYFSHQTSSTEEKISVETNILSYLVGIIVWNVEVKWGAEQEEMEKNRYRGLW